MKYRIEIDGLRALAVVPVILFHAGFELFSGGFVGVDVFFVISGYLITTNLIIDIEHDKFSIISFYERRARRILPALTVTAILSTVAAWVFLSDASLYKFGNALIGLSAFVSNVVFWLQQGYFAESSELNPLLHTWSLAVEEQYYLIFPIFLILAWNFAKNKVFWLIVAMAIFSLLISEWGWRNHPIANFYLAPSRAWELFAGSIAAFITQKRGVQKNSLLSLLGLVAILFSFFAYDENTPFPSIYTLVPVLGVVLFILYADKETFAARILSTKAFVGIGLISYSAYLWHQPLFAFARTISNQIVIGYEIRFLLILITFISAYISWRFIEKPFRNVTFLNRKAIFGLSLSSLLLLLILGVLSKSVVPIKEHKLAQELSENKFVYFENMDERLFVEGRLIYPLKHVDHVIVGSSRVMQISSETIGEPILNFTVSGASIEDDVAILLEAIAKIKPKNVYIAADPWLLNAHDNQNRYKSINTLYEYWFDRMPNNMPLIPHFSSQNDSENLITASSFLMKTRESIHYSKLSIPTNDKVEAVGKKAYDGLHIYNEAYVNSTKNIKDGFPGILNYAMKKYEFDVNAEKTLFLLIDYIHNLGINVTLVLSPYHPELYELMKIDKPVFLEIENKFRDIAKDRNVKIIGSYDPSQVSCHSDEFFDGMHPKPDCVSKLFHTTQ